MGYGTNFASEFTVTPPLKEEHRLYLTRFSDTRRMNRNPEAASRLPDPCRKAVDLPIGEGGGYFVGGGGFAGQDCDGSILDYNDRHLDSQAFGVTGFQQKTDPAIAWNDAEKFYAYEDWLIYLIEHFLGPWGYKLNGEVSWFGDDYEDSGILYCKDNLVEAVVNEILKSWPILERLITKDKSMPRYEIHAKVTREMTFEIEAESEEEAVDALIEDEDFDDPPVEYDGISIDNILSVKEIGD